MEERDRKRGAEGSRPVREDSMGNSRQFFMVILATAILVGSTGCAAVYKANLGMANAVNRNIARDLCPGARLETPAEVRACFERGH